MFVRKRYIFQSMYKIKPFADNIKADTLKWEFFAENVENYLILSINPFRFVAISAI